MAINNSILIINITINIVGQPKTWFEWQFCGKSSAYTKQCMMFIWLKSGRMRNKQDQYTLYAVNV